MLVEIPDHGEHPKWEFQESQMFISPLDLCSYDCEDMSLKVEGRIYDLFINQRCAECHIIDTMSNGSMSPDLGEMCRHGYPASPQWEVELELDSASDCDNEHEEDNRLVARNRAAENGPRDYISVLRGSSLWILIRDSLGPPDVLGVAHGWVKMEQRKIVRRIRSLAVLSLDKRWERREGSCHSSRMAQLVLRLSSKLRFHSKHDRIGRVARNDRLHLLVSVDLSRQREIELCK